MTQDVLVFGATGRTGGMIVNSLLDSPGKFNVFLAIRPSLASKTVVKEFKEKGAKIVLIDITSPKADLLAVVKGKDVVISMVISEGNFKQLEHQIVLADAAKEAGVKRFIPCDFGTPCVRGIQQLYDVKAKIHDHIKEIGLGHTYIDVGWWFQNNFPSRTISPEANRFPILLESAKYLYEGNHCSMYTDLYDISPFVARIIDDHRTLNQYVVIWGEEVTQKQILSLYHEVTGEEWETKPIRETDVRGFIEKAEDTITASLWEYIYSIWIHGDNTLENAKKEEYGNALDVRKLYPDIKVRSLADFAKEFLA